MPNTPGSVNDGEDIAFRLIGNWTGEAVFRTERMCRHRNHQEETRTIKPTAQTRPNAARIRLPGNAADAGVVIPIKGETTKDSVNRSAMTGRRLGTTVTMECREK